MPAFHFLSKSIILLLTFVALCPPAHSRLGYKNLHLPYVTALNNNGFCCESIYKNIPFDSLRSQQLGQEFKRLKALNCNDCDLYGSDLAEIMRTLAKKLSGASKKDVKSIMGKPDEKKMGLLIYHWRGRHDYLIFDFQGKNAAVVNWYHAFE